MQYIDLTVSVGKDARDEVSGYVSSLTSAGIYIEDYTDLVHELGTSSVYDYIDEDLLESDRENVKIHLYPSGEMEAGELEEKIRSYCLDKGISADIICTAKEQEDWETSWQERVDSVLAGPFEVLPEWKQPQEQGRIPLRIDTTEAYGSGQSPNTRLCLEALSALDLRGKKVLDMGTGSGILAVAALLLGADEAIGLDIESESLANAPRNAEKNGVGDRFRVFLRSSQTVRDLERDFDVLFAHITADVILSDRKLYHDLLKPGGILLAGGIVSERKDEVLAGLEKAGFGDLTVAQREEWVTVTCRRRIS